MWPVYTGRYFSIFKAVCSCSSVIITSWAESVLHRVCALPTPPRVQVFPTHHLGQEKKSVSPAAYRGRLTVTWLMHSERQGGPSSPLTAYCMQVLISYSKLPPREWRIFSLPWKHKLTLRWCLCPCSFDLKYRSTNAI